MTINRLVLVGSVIADVVMTVPALPPRGGDVLASAATATAGGGFNVLVAARRLGLPCALAGRVGDGPFGRIVSNALAGADIDLLLPPGGGDSGFSMALVEPDAERTFVTSPGVEAALSVDDLVRAGVRPDDAVCVSGYDLCYPVTGPAVAVWLSDLEAGVVVLDPGPLVAEIPDAVLAPVLERVDVLTLNARELRLLARDDDVASAVPAVLGRLALSAVLIVRDGARGCTMYSPEPVHYPAFDVAAVDSTGAGDAHTGALVAELARTGSWPAAVVAANAAAALSVTMFGPATAPDRATLSAFLAGQ